MKLLSILDASGGQENKQPGVAWHWLNFFLKKKTVEIVDPGSAKFILVTCVGVEQWRFVRKVKKQYPNSKVIVGGPAASSPAVFKQFADAICVGDGQNFLHTFIDDGFQKACELPNICVKGKKSVVVDNAFIWDCPPQYKLRMAGIEYGRAGDAKINVIFVRLGGA